MARRFLRNVRVTVGDDENALRVEDLLIKFRLRREATDTPAEGFISIYNLTPANEQRIRERGVRVRLEAGYGGRYALLFDGDIRRVERIREPVDRGVKIAVGGNVAKHRRAVSNRTYEGATGVRTIFEDAALTMALDVGPLDLIPADAVLPEGFAFQGPTRALLSALLQPFDLRWYEDNGVIRITKQGFSTDDRPEGVLVNQRSGMIGSPTVTDDGIRVKSLLDARLRLDTRIRVESELVDPGERWKVVEVTHQGDNREGAYETIVEAHPLEDVSGEDGF